MTKTTGLYKKDIIMLGLSVTKIVKTVPLLLLVLVIPLLKSSHVLDQGLLIRFISLQLVLLVLLIMILFDKRKNLQLVRSQLLIICFLFVIYTGIHLLWGNVYSDSVFEWLKIVSFFLLLLFLIQLYSFNELKSGLTTFLSLLGIVLATIGAVELFQLIQAGKLNIPLSTYQIKTVFGHRNLYAQILFLSFPFLIYQLFTTKSRFFKTLSAIFTVTILSLLIVLSNRAVWLALIAGFVFMAILHFWFRKKIITPPVFNKINLRIIAISLFITLLLTGLFFTFFTHTSEAEKHLSNIVKIETGSGKDRLELWKRTLNIIEEKPIFGCGAANWKIEMLKYGSKGLVSENNITFYQRPHNDFLWIFSEYGLLGGLLYLLTFLWAFALLISQIKTEKDRSNLLFNYAVLYSLTGITIFSFFSFPHERIVHNIILSSLFATIILDHYKDKTITSVLKGDLLKIVFYSVSALLILVSIVYGYQRFASELHAKKALIAKMENRYSSVITEINKAASPFYLMDPLSTPLWWYEGLAWYQIGEADSAIKYFQKAKQINPYHVHVLNNLASAYSQKGETKKSIETYKEAMAIYPDFDEAALNLCAIYYNAGQTDSAFAVLKKIDIYTPNPKYKTFLKAVLVAAVNDDLKIQGKEDLIVSLPKDEEWYYQQYKISVSENIPIKNLIFESLNSNNINK